MSSLAPSPITPEEYLRIERALENRNELINGQIRPVPYSGRSHGRIVSNLVAATWPQLRGTECFAYIHAMRVKVATTGLYTYPDFVAHCGKAQCEDGFDDTLLNPSVIVEVLSDATETYDRGNKFWHYRRLDSLCEYILVSSDLPRIEQFVRDGELWTLKEVSGLGALMEITTLGCAVSLAEVYEGVGFPSPEERDCNDRPWAFHPSAG